MKHGEFLKLCNEQPVPIDALTQPIALLGNRGGGKTYGGMKIFELASDCGVQCGAIDPVGKWWGLRLGKDGQAHGGLEDVYIFGGKHADFPLLADKGAFIAKLVVEKRIHFVLDVSLMRKGERRRFLADFLDELHLIKKQQDNPTPLVLFIEEAHAVAPQKPGPDEARMLGAIEDIVREGRNAGVGVVLMDQRPATVNKNVLNLTEVLIALRIVHNIDRKVIAEWIVQKAGEQVKLSDKLPFFKNGKGYLYAPVYELFGEIQILPKRTYDSTASVKIGQHREDTGKLTPVDVDAVKSAMAEVLEQAQANDPKALRAKVKELELKLQSERATDKSKGGYGIKVEKVELPMVSEKQVKDIDKLLEQAKDRVADCREMAASFERAFIGLSEQVHQALRDGKAMLAKYDPPKVSIPPAPKGAVVPKLDRSVRIVRQSGFDPEARPTGELAPAALNVLRLVARCNPAAVTRKHLATMAGYTGPSNSAFRKQLYELTGRGLLVAAGGSVAMNDAAWLEVGWEPGKVGPPPSPEEIVQLWREKLEPTACKMFNYILQVGVTSRAELAAHFGYTGPSNSAFRKQFYELTGSGLVEASGGEVCPVALLIDGPMAA